ncbi:gamma-D-glutamyl-L-lysine endopeptidase [Clostridium homopropionicum DSM 5847]|uniref:Gamma-D-glutamyl-L-lysine endopeptidase n=1 Tax=Clostridium homopropionicum DSM 5847 TaxID=1121318 RepID=A0A0L6Z818_9CLOT|nr:gamma-D-glutamyl-L-lysine endopeptidase [Clostridium homopropionicum DSM 5847]SFG83737.1 Cell wall-associated hydrolase, NlpC family [Clostridium homopropionicum]
MHKKVSYIVTSALLIVAMSTTAVLAEPLSDKLKQQQTEMQEHKSQYNTAKQKVDEIESKIEHFDWQIEALLTEIEENKTKIKSIENDIEISKREVQKAEEEIKAEQDLYNERMKTMYMNGVGGYLDVVLGAESLSDLFEKVEIVKKITELDKKIVNELKEKQEALNVKQEKLKEEQTKLIALNNTQEEKKKALEKDKSEQDKLIADARRQADAYESVVKEDQAKIKETKRLIAQMTAKVSSSSKPSRGSASYSSDAVVSYAAKFLGAPYVWGANGAESFDCSGFTKYVYAHFDVRLPRVSRDQAEVGTYVAKSDLQPGDLVFFGYNGGSGSIHHVGIYVGNDSYIHAPRTGDVVKISSLSSRSDYATARRVR